MLNNTSMCNSRNPVARTLEVYWTTPAYSRLATLVGSWMGLFVGCQEARRADVRVDLRRDEALVTEQFLHAPNVRATIEKMGRKTVPQRVRASCGDRGRFRGGTSPASAPHFASTTGGPIG